jgi:hypothetical protein
MASSAKEGDPRAAQHPPQVIFLSRSTVTNQSILPQNLSNPCKTPKRRWWVVAHHVDSSFSLFFFFFFFLRIWRSGLSHSMM